MLITAWMGWAIARGEIVQGNRRVIELNCATSDCVFDNHMGSLRIRAANKSAHEAKL